MPLLQIPLPNSTGSTPSSLGIALGQLQHNVSSAKKQEKQAEELYQSFQEKWSRQQTTIVRRLELIDEQIDRLSKKQQRTQFSIVGATSNQPRLTVTSNTATV